MAQGLNQPWIGENGHADGADKERVAMTGHQTGHQILVVDDDPEMTDLLEAALGDVGYRVRAAPNAAVATEMVCRTAPDLIVTDLSMPDASGLDLAATVRARYPHLPMILLTAFGDWPSFCRARDLDIDCYLTKPVSMQALVKEVARLLVKPKTAASHIQTAP